MSHEHKHTITKKKSPKKLLMGCYQHGKKMASDLAVCPSCHCHHIIIIFFFIATFIIMEMEGDGPKQKSRSRDENLGKSKNKKIL